MTTHAEIAASLTTIVESNASGHDDPCGMYYDGDAIANSTFNYATSLAIEAAVARSLDASSGSDTHRVLLELIAELKATKIPQ